MAGGRPSIPTYLAGAPNCMMSAKRMQVKSKVINIIINLSVSGRISADEIIKAGAKTVNDIVSYESNGIRCNVYVVNYSKSDDNYAGVFIKIKDSNAPLNRLNIAYPIINPSMTRRHFFKWMETYDKGIDPSFAVGYGCPVKITAEEVIRAGIFGNNTPLEIYNPFQN